VSLALATAAPSQAACGGVVDVPAAHHPRSEAPPLAIGDSTMLLAAYPLASEGFEVNAHGCRQWPEALALIRARKAAGMLPHMVVIALGGNGFVTPDDVGATLGVLCCHSWLVLVTPRQLGGGSGENAIVEREDARRHHNRIILIDWVKYSAGHGDWFQPDGLHLTTAGATAFTQLLKPALRYAYPKPKPKRKRRRSRRHRQARAARAVRRRLSVDVTSRVLVGSSARVAIRARWGTGALPLSVCVAPPGAARSCQRVWLRPRRRSRVLSIPIVRPGGWRFSIWTRFHVHRAALVWAQDRSDRIRLLAAGDSEMQILDGFLAQDLAGHGVDVTSDARISTGLTKPSVFNWERHAIGQARSLRPDVTLMFIGANDGFAVAGPHGRASCCGPEWSAGYANLVAQMMHTYLRGEAGRVYWFVLPEPRPGNFQSLFGAINAGVRAAAARFPGRVGLLDANSFFTPGGRYRDFMSYQGRGFVIHQPDGIHLSFASDAVVAQLVVQRLIADRVIR
jgi:lysophospholipase L1-like esterase